MNPGQLTTAATTPAAELIAQISYHHHQAGIKAAEAIFHAKEAGRLLVEIKAALPHGEFGKWMDDNLNVTSRQAQRYMEAARGKKPEAPDAKGDKDKTDIKSQLPKLTEIPKLTKPLKLPPPVWQPKDGFSYSGVWDSASYFVGAVFDQPGHFHISRLMSDRTSLEDGDTRVSNATDFSSATVPANQVQASLQAMGMAEPGKLWWSVQKTAGTDRPFGDF
uniref:DUF3102 domain-containing protein n=1 Tax=Polaromonas sp. H8N TaxID=1840297 RepID=A0A2S1FID2_9BURK|nr:DUF3102 domain-containing protein [Polaromonas sp. H8N]AWD72268.1 hypothetical protein pH8NP1_p007 [Polaromonas sp. H8N]